MKLLIIGSKGQLGRALLEQTQTNGMTTTGVDLPDCDITDPRSIDRMVGHAGQIEAVINAAAYTAVDAAESESEAAFAVNGDGAANLAQACARSDVPLIHLSTDYVFDGLKTSPYLPSDSLSPQGVYGQSKAAGEAAVRQRWDRHVIVRTSWLFGLQGDNFVKTMLRLFKEREELGVVDDQIGCPTYAGDLAKALLAVAAHVIKTKAGWGTYHFCNANPVTWYAFARRIFTLTRSRERYAIREIRPILTAHYPLPAPRPACSVLDCTSFEETFGVERRPWDAALQEMLALLYQQA